MRTEIDIPNRLIRLAKRLVRKRGVEYKRVSIVMRKALEDYLPLLVEFELSEPDVGHSVSFGISRGKSKGKSTQ